VKAASRRVLFVCMGNICRSPAAEGVLGHLIAGEGLAERIEVDSAGILSYHAGEAANRRMRQAAAARGYDLVGRARQVGAADFRRFDLIVAMDSDNLRDLRAIAAESGVEPGAALRLFSDFLPDGVPVDVPDPYYGGAGGFDRVLDLLEVGCPRLLRRLSEAIDVQTG
jgi:low molecular weight protein-tyrosine phosphatase